MRGRKRASRPPKKIDGRFNEDRNANWQKNHALIVDAMRTLIGEKKRLPTNVEIAKRANVNENTVASHLREFDWTEHREKLRLLTPQVLTGNAMAAIAGRARNVQLHMYYIEDVPIQTSNVDPDGDVTIRARVNLYMPENGRNSA